MPSLQVKWYTDDAHLMRILCSLHLLSASCSSNVSGVPPRFIGLLYDARLSSEAATLAAVMARLSEAVYTINNHEEPFAKCQVRARSARAGAADLFLFARGAQVGV